jgi:hypothetical protein
MGFDKDFSRVLKGDSFVRLLALCLGGVLSARNPFAFCSDFVREIVPKKQSFG